MHSNDLVKSGNLFSVCNLRLYSMLSTRLFVYLGLRYTGLYPLSGNWTARESPSMHKFQQDYETLCLVRLEVAWWLRWEDKYFEVFFVTSGGMNPYGIWFSFILFHESDAECCVLYSVCAVLHFQLNGPKHFSLCCCSSNQDISFKHAYILVVKHCTSLTKMFSLLRMSTAFQK